MKQMLLCHCVRNHASYLLIMSVHEGVLDVTKVELHACFLDNVVGLFSHSTFCPRSCIDGFVSCML